MASLSLSPVMDAVDVALRVAGLTALVSSRIYDDVPQAPTYPFVWYEAQEREQRGMGTGGFPEVDLRVHVFSTYQGTSEGQAIAKKVIELLKDQALTVSGYVQAGRVFYDSTQVFADQIIQGVKVREFVAQFRVYVEES